MKTASRHTIRDDRIGNVPAAFVVKLWEDLHADYVPYPMGTAAETDASMRLRHERIAYLTWITHQGRYGSIGLADFIADLPVQ